MNPYWETTVNNYCIISPKKSHKNPSYQKCFLIELKLRVSIDVSIQDNNKGANKQHSEQNLLIFMTIQSHELSEHVLIITAVL